MSEIDPAEHERYIARAMTPPQYRNTGWLYLVPITGMDAPNVISLDQKRAERAAVKSSDQVPTL